MMLLTAPVSSPRLRSAIIGALLGFCITEPLLAAQSPPTTGLNLSSGEAIYGAACTSCHGPAGQGKPDTTIGFDKPGTFPDLPACDQTTPELHIDWKATIRDDRRARGISRLMPA